MSLKSMSAMLVLVMVSLFPQFVLADGWSTICDCGGWTVAGSSSNPGDALEQARSRCNLGVKDCKNVSNRSNSCWAIGNCGGSDVGGSGSSAAEAINSVQGRCNLSLRSWRVHCD